MAEIIIMRRPGWTRWALLSCAMLWALHFSSTYPQLLHLTVPALEPWQNMWRVDCQHSKKGLCQTNAATPVPLVLQPAGSEPHQVAGCRISKDSQPPMARQPMTWLWQFLLRLQRFSALYLGQSSHSWR